MEWQNVYDDDDGMAFVYVYAKHKYYNTIRHHHLKFFYK